MALQNGDGADAFDVVKSSMVDFDPLSVMTQSKGLMGDVTAAIVLAAKVVGLVSIDFGNMTSLADTQPLTGRYNLIWNGLEGGSAYSPSLFRIQGAGTEWSTNNVGAEPNA